jgi:hypothetical protein
MSSGEVFRTGKQKMVRERMLCIDRSLPSGYKPLPYPVKVIDAVRSALPTHDHSFARQMHEAKISNFGTPHYFVTADSAIAVADSIRGFYAASGEAEPRIDYILAQHATASAFWYRAKTEVGMNGAFSSSDIEEIDRLRSLEKDSASAVVIDQMVASGLTVTFAGRLLYTAGFASVSAIRGDWYSDCRITRDQREHVTSENEAFMRSVGAAAYSLATT